MGGIGIECVSMQKKTIFSILLVVAILLAGALFWAFSRGALYFEQGSAFPKFSRSALTNPMPSLNRTPNYPADFSNDAKALYERRVTELTDTIKKDPNDHGAWLDLAIYYRMIGDNAGAVEIWEYLVNKFDTDAVSLHNLAQHYYQIEKDYPKAESYFERSIAASAGMSSNYTDMYEMYRYVYKQDTTAAVDILKRGIAALTGPERIDLKIILARHYRDVLHDTENAQKYLTEARDDATAIGDRGIANEIQRELNAL